MKYLQLFTKTFDNDQQIKIHDYTLIARKEDGYINAGKLCSMCNKQFTHWLINKRSQDFLTELRNMFTETGIYDIELYTTGNAKYRAGTYVHPLVAINIAQWASPKFEVRIITWIYELFLNDGKVDLYESNNILKLEELRVKSLIHEHEELKKKYYKLEVRYEKLKEKKIRHQFKVGNCFYIVRDVENKNNVYKFGQTSNFTNRLTTLRTSSPRMIVERLIYIEKYKEFEDCVKQYFRDNGHLRFSNREYVEIPLEYVNKIVDSFLEKFECDIYDTPVEMLKHINQKYLDCMEVNEKTWNNDAIFQYIQQQNDIQIEHIEKIQHQTNIQTENIEKINDKFEQKLQNQDVIHTENIEKINSKIEKLEECIKPCEKTIKVTRNVKLDNLILENFEYVNPLKRRIRDSDFNFIVETVTKKCDINSHRWFIHQFIFHICYYTGLAPKHLIKLTRDDIVDFLSGKLITIDNKYPVFNNPYITEKVSFLTPYLKNLLPGGMVNQYGNRLTYRQLSKWAKFYFEKLEIHNFGKTLPQEESYRLYDFKTVLMFRLYNSGMSISDISTFLHHKYLATTQAYLNKHKMIYDDTFYLDE